MYSKCTGHVLVMYISVLVRLEPGGESMQVLQVQSIPKRDSHRTLWIHRVACAVHVYWVCKSSPNAGLATLDRETLPG